MRTLNPILTLAALAVTIVPIAAGANSLELDSTALPQPITDADYYDTGRPSADAVELGRMLFFDKELSGNRNISCATCHHPEQASGDGMVLPLGEGAAGLGAARRTGDSIDTAVHARVPRNSPALFNLGAQQFDRLYHDGRVEADPNGYFEGGYITPAKWKLPTGLDNVLAAQAMFPVTSPTEMAGQKGENSIADARSLNNAAGAGGVWEQLAGRLGAIPGYVELFRRAYPDTVEGAEDITFVLAANAIAAFEAEAFRADSSPFDRYLQGEATALDDEARSGMELFYGKAGCASCHSGAFQTDHSFHAIAMPQIGPGKDDGADGTYWRETGLKGFPEDFGRGRVTFREEDRYKFRTPTLRNVELTGPWGHAGAYSTLEQAVRHHLDPLAALEDYRAPSDLLAPIDRVLEVTATGSSLGYSWLNDNRLAGFKQRDTWVLESPELRRNLATANELATVDLSEGEVRSLLAFLGALTDPSSRNLSHVTPDRVPSGLPVAD